MYLYTVEDLHNPGRVVLVGVQPCEECKALVASEDYEDHVGTHNPKKETPTVPKEKPTLRKPA